MKDIPLVEQDLIKMLSEDNSRMRKAGSNLAIAALRVVRDYDGLHRLSLAIAEWSQAIANEGGRGDTTEK